MGNQDTSNKYYQEMGAIWESHYPSTSSLQEVEAFHKEMGLNSTIEDLLDQLMNHSSLVKNHHRILEFGCDNGIMLNYFKKYKLNRLESFTENSPLYLFPLKIAAWTLLFIALILTNMLALIYWPFSAIAKLTRSEKTSSNQIIDISSEYELRKLVAKHDHVLVDFWAEWCGPCLLMNSAIESVSSKYSSEVVVAKVDASLNSNVRKSFGVRGLPTIIVFRNGAEFKRCSGALTVNQISDLVEEAKSQC